MVARAQAAEQTRARLLESAWRHFSEQPFDAVRLADVAAQAGVSLPTLHNNFGTKDALFAAAWGSRMGVEETRRESAAPGDARAALRALYDSYEQEGDAVLRMLAQEERIPAVKKQADGGRAWHRAWVARTFRAALGIVAGAARERRLTELVVATDLLVWKLLRREMGLPRRAAEGVVLEMIAALEGLD
jgi:AcrR family transcriptional regulator